MSSPPDENLIINIYDMNLRTKYERYFRTACTALLLLAFVGCTNDKLVEYGSGDATGKVVMVSLKVGIPPRCRACVNERIFRR